jgi:uncharacterized protein YaaR (DUF327 family)
MEIHEIVEKLIGPINPVGETNADDKRFENLKKLCAVVNELVTDIDNVAYHYKDSQEYSVKRAADYAKNFLTNTLGITE